MQATPRDLWRQSLLALTNNLESASAFLDQRLRFTSAVARELTKGDSGSALLYGVWLQGHNQPVYIGQTLEGKRRLWDLPIGESHHLSNSFPPETWGRVVVVDWLSILETDLGSSAGALLQSASTRFAQPNQALGLALEHLLQHQCRPLFNLRKKKRDGNWRTVDWSRSRSIGALAATHVAKLFEVVLEHWTHLAQLPMQDNCCVIARHGRVVFPSLVPHGDA